MFFILNEKGKNCRRKKSIFFLPYRCKCDSIANLIANYPILHWDSTRGCGFESCHCQKFVIYYSRISTSGIDLQVCKTVYWKPSQIFDLSMQFWLPSDIYSEFHFLVFSVQDSDQTRIWLFLKVYSAHF